MKIAQKKGKKKERQIERKKEIQCMELCRGFTLRRKKNTKKRDLEIFFQDGGFGRAG